MTPTLALPAPGDTWYPDKDTQALAPTPQDEKPRGVQPLKLQFSSSLQITPKQCKDYENASLTRFDELRREMGLTVTNEVMPGSWMWRRRCNEQYYQGDLSWRLAFGGIFQQSNITLGSGLRHVRYNAARMQDDLLGTQPFMAALAAKQGKEVLAKQIDGYIQNRIESGNIRTDLREAQKIALYRNECVIKIGYEQDATPYKGPATVLVDIQNNEPIKTPHKQRYIYQDDNFIEHPAIQGAGMLEPDPSFIAMKTQWDGVLAIPPDAENPSPRLARYAEILDLPQRLVQHEGTYSRPLDYRAFLCPLKVDDIHKADTVIHLYLDTPSRVAMVYGGIDVAQDYFSWWDRPGQDKPKYEQGEGDIANTVIFQQIAIAEMYRRVDIDGDGEEEEVFSVFDMTNRRIIYYNYLANHMKKRPFEVIPGLEKIPCRWYGRGIYSMLDSHLFYEDTELSRSFFKNSKNATIQFAYRDACESWANGLAPVIGDDNTYWIRPNWNAEGKPIRPIWRENLSENIAPDQELQNVMRQSADSLVGNISTASANESGFNQSKTATGNQLVQQAADIICRAAEEEQGAAIDKVLAQVVDFELEHMDPVVLAADPETDQLATVNREEARSLSRDVRLLRTRSKSTQLLSTSAQALTIAKDYKLLVAQSPKDAKDLRPLYIQQLKGLEVQDADTIIPDVTQEDIDAFNQRQQAASQQANRPPAESMSLKPGDLVGNERDQFLQKFGINADRAALQQKQAGDAIAAQQEAEAKAAASRKVVNIA